MTHVMTEKETRAWFNAYFFGKRCGYERDFTEIYRGKWTWIYEWNLDENVEVIEALIDDEEIGECFTYTVNFYEDKFSGTPYRTGTMKIIGA